jgi:peptide/nickel transport system substrate-binding protein
MFRDNSMMRAQFLLLLAAILLPAIPAALQGKPEQAARWPERLVYAAGIVPRGLNPLLDRNGWNEVSSVIVGRLVRPDHKGGFEGDLAESWTVSDDGRTYALKLREGVFWHDGKPFTAADVHFTWQRLVHPKTETTLDLNQAMLHSFRTQGTHGFVFTLKAPDTGFLAALTEIGILPAHRLLEEDINGDAFDRAPIGTGPYILETRSGAPPLNRDGAEFHFRRHERYHRGRPAFEALTIRIIADDDARARAVAEGAADVGHVKPPHVAMLRERGRRVLRMRTGAWRGMPMNLARPALADKRVRQAIDLAIDREEIVRVALEGYGEAGYSPIPPASWAFHPAMNAKRYDPARAEALLDAAGWRRGDDGKRRREGQPLRLEFIIWKDEFFRRTAGELIQKQLGKLGIEMELHRVDGTTYNRLAESMGQRYDTFIGGWGGLLDPGDNLYKKYHSGGSQNRMGFRDAELDGWLTEVRSLPVAAPAERERAIAMYRRIVERITDAAVFLPLAYPDYLFALRPELAGVEEYTLDSWYEFTKYAAEWKPTR